MTRKKVGEEKVVKQSEIDAKQAKADAKAQKEADALKAEADKKLAGQIKKADSVDVLRNEGKIFIRTYSEAVHGEDFMSLAEQFQQKHPTVTIVPSDSIKTVVVNYREKEDAELPLDKQSNDSPFVDKSRSFSDKEEGLAFCNAKHGTISVGK